MFDLDWEVVTKGKVYRRLRDRLALSSLIERLSASLEEILGFTVFFEDLPLISWDTENGKLWVITEDGHVAVDCPKEGTPFCRLVRMMSTTGEEAGRWEFGVEPWSSFTFDGKELTVIALNTEVKDEQS